MASALKFDTYPHIVKEPGVRGGKACIQGTRVAVADLISASKAGRTPEELKTYFSSRPLTLAEVHAALAYYYDNADEIEAVWAANERAFDDLDRRWQEHLARHGGEPDPASARAEGVHARPFPWPPKP